MATDMPHGRRFLLTGAALGAVMALSLGGALGTQAATRIDGPVNLGTAADFGVLGASAVTNTGPTVVNGDVGISPDTSITGFGGLPDGVVNGTIHQTDAVAALAQQDTTTAYNVAASLTPTETGLDELTGLSLSPGVYSGGELLLSNNGTLTLAGSAESVWVFQAASTLTIGSGTQIIITGGASACNVFWQVGSSASIGTTAQFQGTVLALASITATTGAVITGRLLARTAAVTLDTNTITASTGCPPPGTVTETAAPVITSETPTDATAETPYSHTVTASGTPAPTFTVTSGSLPEGLTLDEVTGEISGTPSARGTSTFTITADNGEAPAATATYELRVAPAAAAPPTETDSATSTSTATETTPALAAPPADTGGSDAVGTPEIAATGLTTTSTLTVGVLAIIVGAALMTIASIRRRSGWTSQIGARRVSRARHAAS